MKQVVGPNGRLDASRSGNGWREVRLSEVCEFIRGVSFDKSEVSSQPIRDYLPILRAGNIGDELDVVNDLVWVPDKKVSAQQRMRPGDIAICMSSGSASIVGKSASLKQPFDGSVGAFCGIIRTHPDVDADYIAHWFRSEAFVDWRDGQARGANIQNLRFSQMEAISLQLPPLAEQRRIAALLDEQLAAVGRARSSGRDQVKGAKLLVASYLWQAFSGLLDTDTPLRPVGELAKVQSGYAFKSEWFSSDGIRLLRNANVFQGYIDWSDLVRLPEDRRSEFSNYELKRGDIVLSLDRPIVSNGLKVARLSVRDVPSLLLQRVGRFRLGDALDPDYLYAFLNSPMFVAAIGGHDQSLGVPHISPAQVEAVKLPLPPLEEQRRVAALLSHQLGQVRTVREALDEQLKAIEALPSALLRQAYSGEL